MQKTFYLESYGCSSNSADAGAIAGMLCSHGFQQVDVSEKAEFILLNSCAVKKPTEHKMLRKLRALSMLAEKSGARLLLCGCMPKISPEAAKAVSHKIVLAGPGPEAVAASLGLPHQLHNDIAPKPHSEFVSIIKVAEGCTGKCSYCAVKNARGELSSFSLSSIESQFKASVARAKEVWLTAQDTGCYGLDAGSSLPKLLKRLLKSRKKFRVRVGMMNPQHLARFVDEYLPLFEDPRLYRFFHIPIQSGSDSVLKAMNRPYTAVQATKLCRRIRRAFPLASIATDIIVGFPGETKQGFRKTLDMVRKVEPDVLNISRFGIRPNTSAAGLPGQLHGRVKKERSRALTVLHKKTALERNRLFLGLEQEIIVSKPGPKGNFVGRNNSYKPVVVEKNALGKFALASIEHAFPTYLKGRIM